MHSGDFSKLKKTVSSVPFVPTVSLACASLSLLDGERPEGERPRS